MEESAIMKPPVEEGKEDWRDFIEDPEVLKTEISIGEKTAWVKHYRITRWMRDRALSKAADAYKRDLPKDYKGDLESGIMAYKDVFERELALLIIKDWSLPKPIPVWWQQLNNNAGDKIVEALGINNAFQSYNVSESKEVNKAKN